MYYPFDKSLMDLIYLLHYKHREDWIITKRNYNT